MPKRNVTKNSRQQQIINAARKLIFKHGSKHLTIRNIAREVGVSEAAIYLYFPSKMSIMSVLADHIANNLLGDIEKAVISAHSGLEALDLTMRNHFSAIEQRRGLSFRVIAEITAQGDKKLSKKVAGIIDDYTNALQNLLLQGVTSGEIREDIDLQKTAQLIFGMIQALVTTWTLGNRNFSLVERYEEHWKFFLSLIINKSVGYNK